MPAPAGKDADPKESLWDFEGRGRRLAVIGARDFACNVAARPTRPAGRLRPSSHDLYVAPRFLDAVLKTAPDHEAMDVIAIALAVGVFAVLALLIEGLDRV
jgi:hypothetical protein